MKRAFAILISLVLLVTQSAFMTAGMGGCPTPQKASPQNCCATHCQKHCCVTKSDAPSAPSAPATQTISQIDLQSASTALLALDQSAAGFSPPASPDSSVLSVTAAPLYQRNCSYLL
jgi:hypothetical protein